MMYFNGIVLIQLPLIGKNHNSSYGVHKAHHICLKYKPFQANKFLTFHIFKVKNKFLSFHIQNL